MEHYEFNVAMDCIWARIGALDERMTNEAPFKLVKTDLEAAKRIITEMAEEVYVIGTLLEPFMPETSKRILETVRTNKKPETMFPRINE